MDNEQDWDAFLDGHPVFGPQKDAEGKDSVPLELSLENLAELLPTCSSKNPSVPSGRRQLMAIKDSDIIIAAGSEIRMASLIEGRVASASVSGDRAYKVSIIPSCLERAEVLSSVAGISKTLHTPNMAFEIHQIALNPNAKFLAVASAYQVAVVVLPRASSTRLASSVIDCKCVNFCRERIHISLFLRRNSL